MPNRTAAAIWIVVGFIVLSSAGWGTGGAHHGCA
jgi:hypothetical protein